MIIHPLTPEDAAIVSRLVLRSSYNRPCRIFTAMAADRRDAEIMRVLTLHPLVDDKCAHGYSTWEGRCEECEQS